MAWPKQMVLTIPLKFWQLSFARKLACLEAVIFLIAAKVSIKVLKYKSWSKLLGPIQKPNQIMDSKSGLGSHKKLHQSDIQAGKIRLADTRWAIQTVAETLPFHFVCLPRAIAGKWMLARREISADIHLGIKRSLPEHRLSNTGLHAWLSVDDNIILGGEVVSEFKEIAVYGE